MRTPIAYSLAWPNRMATPVERLDLASISQLTFEAPDFTKFPAISLAFQALKSGGSAPTILNAANEVAVEAFLDEVIPFTAIPVVIEQALDDVESRGGEPPATLDDVRSVDARTREFSRALVSELQSRR